MKTKTLQVASALAWDLPASVSYQAGQELRATLNLTAPEAGNYYLLGFLFEQSGNVIQDTMFGVLLPEGGARARLIARTDGRAVIDCFRLEPAPKADGAIEAEELKIARWSGGEEPHTSQALRGPSAGRILEWHADAPRSGRAAVCAP